MGIYRLAPLVDVFGTVLADVEIWADGDVVGGVAVSRAALENLKMKNMRAPPRGGAEVRHVRGEGLDLEIKWGPIN